MLVDTPGVGSIYAWNTEITRGFVPQVDAAVVLVGADPPLSELELRLVEQLAGQNTALLFAINKSDRMAPSEVSEAREFTQRALSSRLTRHAVRIFEVSATERLLSGPTRDWSSWRASWPTWRRARRPRWCSRRNGAGWSGSPPCSSTRWTSGWRRSRSRSTSSA